MSSKKTEAKPEGNTEAKPRAWRVLHPVCHGWVQGGKPVSRIWQSGELMELSDAQAAPLLARGVIEALDPAAPAAPTTKE